MSAFYVGQRVRIVGATHPACQEFIGREDVIRAKCDTYPSNWDLVSVSHAPPGRAVSWHESHLQPILLSGLEPAEMTAEELLPFVRETEHA